jgi:hypothetical protein
VQNIQTLTYNFCALPALGFSQIRKIGLMYLFIIYFRIYRLTTVLIAQKNNTKKTATIKVSGSNEKLYTTYFLKNRKENRTGGLE